MELTEAIKAIMKEQKVSHDKLGARLNLTRAAIGERLRVGDMRTETLLQMLAALDYELVLQPRSGAKKPEGAISIERKS